MVNCNPETVCTDYDTSDRLYFERTGVEEVLTVLEREQPVGVVIQFGGQTPLQLARSIAARGVHSGDSACGLPAPSRTAAHENEIGDTVRAIAKGLGVVGLLNVQLAVADGEVFVLEANPRASRTVPFASKATGVNLVQAACSVMAGARLAELDLSEGLTPRHVSVKAAVLPFARFPGADSVLGPEMRATGEVMATAADLPTAFAKAERAAGRALPVGGTAFISVCDTHKEAIVPVAQALVGLGFDLVATAGTART